MSFLLALAGTNNNSKKRKRKNTLTKLKLAGLRGLAHCTWWSGTTLWWKKCMYFNHFYTAALYFSVAWTAKYKQICSVEDPYRGNATPWKKKRMCVH